MGLVPGIKAIGNRPVGSVKETLDSISSPSSTAVKLRLILTFNPFSLLAKAASIDST